MSKLVPVAIVCSTATGYGGAERNMEELLALMADDYRTFILTENVRHFKNCKAIPQGKFGHSVAQLPFLPRPIQLVYGMGWLLYYVIRYQPIVILANSNKAGVVVALASLFWPKLGARTALYVHDFQWRFLEFIAGSLRSATWLFPGPALMERKDYIQRLMVPPHRFAILPNIVERLAPLDHRPESDLAQIVMLGTIQRWKGQEYLIRAFAQITPTARLLFFGDVQEPDYYKRLQALVVSYGVADRVEFNAYVADVRDVYARASCVVVASISEAGGPETFSRVTVEAWGSMKPVIAFEAGGPKYLIENETNGLLIPEKDWLGLASAITRVLQDKTFVARLTAGGSASAASYTPSIVYRTFRDIIDVSL